MIEYVSFGSGFRADGADWGEQTGTYLRGSWRRMAPGRHFLSSNLRRPLLAHELVVSEIGDGILELAAGSATMVMVFQGEDSLLSGRSTQELSVGEHGPLGPVVPVLNADLSEVYAEMIMNRPNGINNAMRLVGALRFLPGAYNL